MRWRSATRRAGRKTRRASSRRSLSLEDRHQPADALHVAGTGLAVRKREPQDRAALRELQAERRARVAAEVDALERLPRTDGVALLHEHELARVVQVRRDLRDVQPAAE